MCLSSPTPIQIDVSEFYLDEATDRYVVRGWVVDPSQIKPGMKVSIGLNWTWALEFEIDSVETLRHVREVHGRKYISGEYEVLVGINAEAPALLALLAGLNPKDKLLLIWNPCDDVDPSEYVVYDCPKTSGLQAGSTASASESV